MGILAGRLISINVEGWTYNVLKTHPAWLIDVDSKYLLVSLCCLVISLREDILTLKPFDCSSTNKSTAYVL